MRPFIIVVVLLAGFILSSKAVAQAQPPNIVLIVADDLGWNDVGYHGSVIRTPNIDALAQKGVRLNNNYVAPLCSPTRAALLTGLYPIRTGMQQGVVGYGHQGLPLQYKTSAEELRAVGYRTGMVGKWHLGGDGNTDINYRPYSHGFDLFYGLLSGKIDNYTHRVQALNAPDVLDWWRNGTLVPEESGTQEANSSTYLLGRDAVQFINAQSATQPFFLYAAFNVPHAPVQPLSRLTSTYKKLTEPRRSYAAVVTAMDEQVGAIVTTLTKRGMIGNTVIVFMSDNGASSDYGGKNTPLRGYKGSMYEGGVRSTSFWYWQGKIGTGVVTKPTIRKTPTHAVDVYPTLLRLAGNLPNNQHQFDTLGQPHFDGLDIWDVIANGAQSPHEDVLTNINPADNRGSLVRQRAEGMFKYVFANGVDQLYNLDTDSDESTNLAGRSAYAATLADLKARYAAYDTQQVPPL